MINTRTADELRPKNFDDIVGQEHLFGKNGVIRKMIGAKRITNMIFYGPPGTGKTTAAEIIAKESDMVFHKLNATSATLTDVKNILSTTNSLFCIYTILLFINFNKNCSARIFFLLWEFFSTKKRHTKTLHVIGVNFSF